MLLLGNYRFCSVSVLCVCAFVRRMACILVGQYRASKRSGIGAVCMSQLAADCASDCPAYYVCVVFLNYNCVYVHTVPLQLLVFAHHKNVLDALQKRVLASGRGRHTFIRIDGRTKPKVMLICVHSHLHHVTYPWYSGLRTATLVTPVALVN